MILSALPRWFAVLLSTSIVLTACGGGGSGSSVSPSSGVTPTPGGSGTPIATSTAVQVTTSTTAAETVSYAAGGDSGSTTFPVASVATALNGTFSTAQPSGTPTIQNLKRRPANIGASQIGAIAFTCITPSATVAFGTYPAFTLTVPASVASSANYTYVALYDPTQPALGWTTIEGPANLSGTTLSFAASGTGGTFQAAQSYCFVIFTLFAALPTPTPGPNSTATAGATATPTAMANAAAYACPTSDAAAAVARSGASFGREATGRASGLRVKRAFASTPGRLAVTYSASAMSGREAMVTARETSAGGSLVRSFAFAHTGTLVHVLAVPVSQMENIAATLRMQSGVESVAVTGGRRYATTVSAGYFPNDPYFNGFTAAQNTSAGVTAPSTDRVGPYEESSSVPGQWDMHVIGLEDAFAYSQAGNGSSVAANAGALGSANVKIAIIDTGADSTHPELASKIVYQHCFITSPSGTQTSSNYETDPLGHGTDVAGIAAAASNNAVGFAGAGGNSVIYAYRVFPTPDDSCSSATSTDPQCGADTNDIASAIDDAVTQGVNVISMSLGGTACGTGSGFAANGDSDPVEGAAVANAIAANIVVVAAAGNAGSSGVASPGCDASVIAAGATSLADGTANGSGFAGGTAAAPIEYVASYSQYGTTNVFRSASSWGIMAPGGDPVSDTADADDLHWIENIWTSTPYQSSASDSAFVGDCAADYPGVGTGGTIDCRTLIAGTSMSTPHVAGAAALILAVNPSYQSPAAMKALLCQTADSVSGTQGCGRLNVYRAMATALNDTPLP